MTLSEKQKRVIEKRKAARYRSLPIKKWVAKIETYRKKAAKERAWRLTPDGKKELAEREAERKIRVDENEALYKKLCASATTHKLTGRKRVIEGMVALSPSLIKGATAGVYYAAKTLRFYHCESIVSFNDKNQYRIHVFKADQNYAINVIERHGRDEDIMYGAKERAPALKARRAARKGTVKKSAPEEVAPKKPVDKPKEKLVYNPYGFKDEPKPAVKRVVKKKSKKPKKPATRSRGVKSIRTKTRR